MAIKNIAQLTRDAEWQKVRKQLLNRWMSMPDWCCLKLRKYLGPINSTPNNKIKIVMNYLTGTGFRTGRINHPCITKLRSELSMEIKKRKAKGTWN